MSASSCSRNLQVLLLRRSFQMQKGQCEVGMTFSTGAVLWRLNKGMNTSGGSCSAQRSMSDVCVTDCWSKKNVLSAEASDGYF